MAYDPRYFTTYYAIDAINFTPVDVSSALPIRSRGLICRSSCRRPPACRSIRPLPNKRKSSMRCRGLFYGCANGAEARHFNRMLIDAGLIKNL